MANQYSVIARFSVAAAVIGLLTATDAVRASPNGRGAWPPFTVIVEKSKEGPPGWAEFCSNYKSECDVKSSEPLKIALTAEVWDKLVDVNKWANGHIKPTPDRKHWGRINKWYFADDGQGDCKDYVIVKRRLLVEAGLPREALLITIVWTPQNNGHAVLLVRTDKGDYALDNLSSRIVLWNQTPYDYVMRQSQFNPNSWVFIDGDPLKPPKIANASIVENPVDEPIIKLSGLSAGMPKREIIAAGGADGGNPKIVSRSLDDSTPSPALILSHDEQGNTPKKEVITTHDAAGANLREDRAEPFRQTTTSQDQLTTVAGSGGSMSKQNANTIVINGHILKQLLASGVDGETLMQLVISGAFKDLGASTTAITGKKSNDGNTPKQRVSAIGGSSH